MVTFFKPSTQLALCIADPETFRANLLAHVDDVAQLGFNAHALGLLASRHLPTVMGTPQALADRFVMLRALFHPCGDELIDADGLRRTNITAECLPAVIRATGSVTAESASISRLHKAMLAGPSLLLSCTPALTSIKKAVRALVAARLFATEDAARRGCMLHNDLINNHTPEWLMERKAAVLEAGGNMDDVRLACSQTQWFATGNAGLAALSALWVRRCHLVPSDATCCRLPPTV